MKILVTFVIFLLISASKIDSQKNKKTKTSKPACKLNEDLLASIAELKNSVNEQLIKLEAKLVEQYCPKDEDGQDKDIVNRDCSTVTSNSGKVADIETVSGKTFQAFCKQGWLSIARRFDGSVDFYRSFQEYEKGFGNASGEYFIGLENLADILSHEAYRLRVELKTWPPVKVKYADYKTFKVAGKSDKYRLTIGNYSGTASDSLKRQNGMAFTTKDMDNDISSQNCAILHTGAWWYDKCHESNLFGTYYNRSKSPYGKGLNWRHWKGYYYSFKGIDMKIYQ